MALFSDYEGIIGAGSDHPILAELFLGRAQPGTGNGKSPRELDGYREKENYFVVNIDSSQHRAIDRAKSDRTVVIQGPPGTGKSQTITNLIADTLSKGKRVLFVSEKRAALDVVYTRLKKAGIEKQTVLLHSSDLNKNELYASFLELSGSRPNSSDARNWVTAAYDLDRTKQIINTYCETLGSFHEPSGLTLSEVFTLAGAASVLPRDIPLGRKFSSFKYESLEAFAHELERLQGLIKTVTNYAGHPWLHRKSSTVYSTVFAHDFEGLAQDFVRWRDASASIQSQLRAYLSSDCSAEGIAMLASKIERILSAASIPQELEGAWQSGALSTADRSQMIFPSKNGHAVKQL
jgi:hypothetical protein